MKYKIASIAITLPLIILFGALFMAQTKNISDAYILSVQQIEEHAKNQRWDQAQQILTELSTTWESKKAFLQLWILHSDADDITRYMKEVQVGLMLRDQSVIFLGTTNLIESLDHLQHKDDLSLTNII